MRLSILAEARKKSVNGDPVFRLASQDKWEVGHSVDGLNSDRENNAHAFSGLAVGDPIARRSLAGLAAE
jgi:hypothetical protein